MHRFITIGDITINLSHVEQVVFSTRKSDDNKPISIAVLRYSSGRDLTFKGEPADILRAILARVSDEEPAPNGTVVTSVSASGTELDPLQRLHNLQKAIRTSTAAHD